MPQYERVSGVFFALISLAHLIRSILRLPAQVGGMQVPIWFSIVAFIATGSLALWAFKASMHAEHDR